MQIASWRCDGEREYGVLDDISAARLSHLFPQYPTIRDILAKGLLKRLTADESLARSRHRCLNDIRLEIPVPDPQKIICAGINYPLRHAEYRDGAAAPERPSLFVRFPVSFAGHGAAIIRPRVSDQFDYEGEIALIIGKSGRNIAEADALGHIAGLTLCNDGTVRDWLRHSKFNVTPGKNFDRSGSMGPWMVPFTDPAQLADIRLETRVNGEVRQSDRTGRMIFPAARLIAYISSFTTLLPGDIILTGTPAGAGARHDPPVWLKPDDVVEIEAEGLGILRNRVEDEQ